MEFLAFAFKYPEVLIHMLTFSISSAIGQVKSKSLLFKMKFRSRKSCTVHVVLSIIIIIIIHQNFFYIFAQYIILLNEDYYIILNKTFLQLNFHHFHLPQYFPTTESNNKRKT